MFTKIREFYNKHRTTILKINDWLLGVLIIAQVVLPEGKSRSIAGALLTIFYGSSTARYYIPKRN